MTDLQRLKEAFDHATVSLNVLEMTLRPFIDNKITKTLP